ncbi:MAG: UbiD family decarboxylase [Hyphomicrobiales bacterium]|nr:UbiD family decarboxylase [Hyphomicrobiales bacterium]
MTGPSRLLTNDVLDTRFRSALARLAGDGRLDTCTREIDPDLELASVMKALDGGPALLFPKVRGHAGAVVGNLLSCQANCESAFGADFRAIRGFVERAIDNPLPPRLVASAPAQEIVLREFDIRDILPALRHAPADAGRFVTAGILIVRDPETGVYNASYHRLQLHGPDRLGVKLDFGRHLRLAYERAKARGENLPVAVVLGADLALHFTAATMGSQMPEGADEMAVAGGLSGAALPVVEAITQPLLVPAESEFIMEGEILTSEDAQEGPFGEFIGFMAPAAPAPVLKLSAVTHRRDPIYPAINGYGRETIMLRKYVLEASLLKVLRSAIPIVVDAEMTAGGLHRFHAIVQVKKQMTQHEGLQRNAILASFGALKDLDYVVVVDDDIDIRDPLDVEYALATRMEASRDLIVIPGARGHEYVRAGNNGIRAKLGIDATVPFEEKHRFARVAFAPVEREAGLFTSDPAAAEAALGLT